MGNPPRPLPRPKPTRASDSDAVVIGAGFGGLAAALTLAEAGARVTLLEQLAYPGGCASTFRRQGHLFEAGATLFSGLHPQGLFGQWKQKHGMDVDFLFMEKPVHLLTPSFSLPIHRDRQRLQQTLLNLPGAPQEGLRRFFEAQRRVADPLWAVLEDPARLDLRDLGQWASHLKEAFSYAPVLRWAGRPLSDVLRWAGVDGFAPFRTFVDAACQITVQCSADEAEAPFALSAMDYFHRGTGHVVGGIGNLAWAMVRAIENLGGEVHFGRRVRRVEKSQGFWEVQARDEIHRAPVLLANLIPQQMNTILDTSVPSGKLDGLAKRVAEGWGAVMLYLVCKAPDDASSEAHHIEIVQNEDLPLVEGNHLFVSISGADEQERAGPGMRTLTVSTHVSGAELHALSPEEQGQKIQAIQNRMRQGLEHFLPQWMAGKKLELPASPRTFARFVGRPGGWVGGIPRRASLGTYAQAFRGALAPGLFLIGDSVFPGQSTLAVATSGIIGARQALRTGQLEAR
jgi:phytoene dehydrogenase-like protein